MHSLSKKLVISALVVLVICLCAFALFNSQKKAEVAPVPKNTIATSTYKVIGASVQGRKIEAYTYGTGATHILFAGGMHGGYEWNSVLLAYQFMDYLNQNPSAVPNNLSVTVIPAINPDGVYEVTGKEGRFTIADVSTSTKILATGRFNADKVDLNRNFDCNWQPKGTWQSTVTSAGTAPFSEPEAAALRDFILGNNIKAAIFWHSASGSVYASQCNKGILPTTLDIMNAYAHASGYSAVKSFDAYPVTGDSEGWLASIGIPALTVELKTHSMIEWDQNLAGIKALLKYYAEK